MKIVPSQVIPLEEIDGEKILLRIQDAAKTCYQTHKVTDNLESAKRIAKNLLASGHHSMLEFGGNIAMRYITNIAGYKDLRTHRHSTWAVESTRWANYSKDKFDNGLTFIQPVEIEFNSPEYQLWLNSMLITERNYLEMAKLGAKPDQLSLILPQSLKAECNVIANIPEWRHILALRSSVARTGHARPCIADIMDQTLELFHEKIPVLFDDLYEELQAKRAEAKLKEEKKKQLAIPFQEFKTNKR